MKTFDVYREYGRHTGNDWIGTVEADNEQEALARAREQFDDPEESNQPVSVEESEDA